MAANISKRIGLISGGFPPDIDGIGDYTWGLGQELRSRGKEVAFFMSKGQPRTPMGDCPVVPFFTHSAPKTFANLESVVRENPVDWLILQYNPFSFGPRGYNPVVASTLEKIRKEHGTKIAVMFHETHVPTWPWRFLLMCVWQWPQFAALCRMADHTFISTQRWQPQVKGANASVPCHHAPVGSNLPLITLSREEAKAKIGASQHSPLVGLFGSAHVSRLLDYVGDAAAAIREKHPGATLVYVGRDGAAVEENCKGIPVMNLGPLDAEAAATAIRAMDLMISPFIDGISTRRTSVISAVQQGTPICTTFESWTDHLFKEFPADSFRMTAATDKQAFIAEALKMAEIVTSKKDDGAELRAAYEKHFSWPAIGQNFISHLDE